MNPLININTNRLILLLISEVHIKEIFENFNEKIIIYRKTQVSINIGETHQIVTLMRIDSLCNLPTAEERTDIFILSPDGKSVLVKEKSKSL